MGKMPDLVGFVDIETTALDRDLLQVWEVALITEAEGEQTWHLPVDLSRADPMSLSMNGFVERYNDWDTPAEERSFKLWEFAREFALYTRGLTLVGANPKFDELALWDLLRDNGECPLWHYRLIDVEALMVGYLRAKYQGYEDSPNEEAKERALACSTIPWKHTDLVRALGINPDDFKRHDALGDARMVKACYEKVMGR